MVATNAVRLGGRPGADTAANRSAGASIWSNALLRLRREKITLIAGGILVLFILLSAAADLLAGNVFHYGFTQQDLLNSYAKPTLTEPAFWLANANDNDRYTSTLRFSRAGGESTAAGSALEAEKPRRESSPRRRSRPRARRLLTVPMGQPRWPAASS